MNPKEETALAVMEGIKLKSLKILAESQADFSKIFGLTDNPIEEINWVSNCR